MIVSFEEYKKKEEEANNYKKSILKIIDEFILFNNEFREVHASQQMNNYFKAIDFYNDSQRSNDFVVKYYWTKFDRTDEVHFTHKEYLELLEFMKNADVYIDSKKYNL